METIRKSEAAKRWGIDGVMISRYIRRGMPVRSDDRLDWQAVDRWRKANVIPQASGSYHFRSRQRVERANPIARLHAARGIDGLVRLCSFFKLNAAQTHLAVDAVLSWVYHTVGDREIHQLFGERGPRVDYSALDSLTLSRAESNRLDEMLERIDEVLQEGQDASA